MSLEIDVTSNQAFEKRISMTGSLDSNTAPQLQENIDTEIDASIQTFVLDFKQLEFLSSAGLRVIFKAKKLMDGRDGNFILVNLQPQIKKVFDIMKALDGMDVFKNEDEMDEYLAAMQNKVLDGE
jgi:anti-sigma B factor antagonist